MEVITAKQLNAMCGTDIADDSFRRGGPRQFFDDWIDSAHMTGRFKPRPTIESVQLLANSLTG